MKNGINYLFAFLGGGVGSALRYWLSGFVYRFLSSTFPYGTLLVNLLGSLTIGILMGVFTERFIANPSLRVFLVIGILGGFTTFSSFSYETISLLKDGQTLAATANIGISIVCCLGATYLGLELGKLL